MDGDIEAKGHLDRLTVTSSHGAAGIGGWTPGLAPPLQLGSRRARTVSFAVPRALSRSKPSRIASDTTVRDRRPVRFASLRFASLRDSI